MKEDRGRNYRTVKATDCSLEVGEEVIEAQQVVRSEATERETTLCLAFMERKGLKLLQSRINYNHCMKS